MAHDHHLVGDLAHQTQIVGDKEHGHFAALAQFGQQLHDLALDRHVQRGGGLISDQQLGLAGQGHRNHDALLLATRELVRIGILAARRLWDTDFLQQSLRPTARLLAAHAFVHTQHLGQLEADGVDRVERAHRVLENHGHVLTADALPIAQPQAHE